MSPISQPIFFSIISSSQVSEINGTLRKCKEIKIPISGVYHCKQIAWSNVDTMPKPRIYKNGTAYGATGICNIAKAVFIEDLNFLKDDLCQLYICGDGTNTVYGESFQISYPANFTPDVQQEV